MKSRKVVDVIFDLLEKEDEFINIRRSIKNFEDFKDATRVFYSNYRTNFSNEHEVKRLASYLLRDKKLNCYEDEIDFKEFVKTISSLFVENKEPNVFLRQFGRFSEFISILISISAFIVSITCSCPIMNFMWI